LSRPLRITVVIESFDPAAGGNERSTQQILRELVERGHEVTLITGCCREENRPPGVELRALSESKSSSVIRLAKFAIFARRELAEGQFDTSLSVTMAVPARVVQPRGGTVRETLERNVALRGGGWASRKKAIELRLDPKQQLLLELERRTLGDPRVRTVVALSRYVVRQLEEHYTFPAERITVIPNAAVMPPHDAEQRAGWRSAVRREHRLPDEATVFLFAATNPRLKGFATLRSALGRLRADEVPVAALLAGGFGDDEQQAISAAGLEDTVRVLGQVQDMAPLYAAADVTVLPTWYDPSSKVVLESLMMSIPAISTVYNGASDHLEPAGAPPRGVVVQDPGDAAELAEAMRRLTDPGFRAACAAACDGLADRLSMQRHVDALEAVLRDAADLQ
jgi:UDP-glucose:(heptosyl)LPS alpha-1,3-glucosyltransferase